MAGAEWGYVFYPDARKRLERASTVKALALVIDQLQVTRAQLRELRSDLEASQTSGALCDASVWRLLDTLAATEEVPSRRGTLLDIDSYVRGMWLRLR